MAVKDIAKQVIDILPDEATMDDIIHALYINAKFDATDKSLTNRHCEERVPE